MLSLWKQNPGVLQEFVIISQLNTYVSIIAGGFP